MNYRIPDHKRAVEDCNEALKLDKKYIKALNRRGNSLEILGQYEEALRGLFCHYITMGNYPEINILLYRFYSSHHT